VADGLLSPDDMMLEGLASGGSILSEDPNFRRFTFLPLGYDASKPVGMPRVQSLRPAIPNALLGAFESANIPSQVLGGELQYGTPEFDQAAQQFSMDFGMLPAVGGALLTPAASNTLRMGAGGGVTRNVRSIDPMGFYSEALEQAKMLPMKSGTGEQFRSMLLKRGVKPDEIKFTPELEGLLAQPRVTQEELVGLLEKNKITPYQQQFFGGDAEFEGMNFPDEAKVLPADEAFGYDYLLERGYEIAEADPVEVADFMAGQVIRRGGKFPDEDQLKVVTAIKEDRVSDLNNRESDLYIDNPFISDNINELEETLILLADDEYQYNPVLRLFDPDTGYEILGSDEIGYTIKNENGDSLRGERYSLSEARIEAENDAMERGLIGFGDGQTRFSDYTEDGGTDYRERLIQIPKYEGSTGDDFTYGDHFDEPNIAVHTRTKSRKMEDGGSTLYVEEMQSDWGQQGRQSGFKREGDEARLDEINSDPILFDYFANDKKRISMYDDAVNGLAKKLGLVRAKADVNPEFFYNGQLKHPDGSPAITSAELLEFLNGRNAVMYPVGEGIVPLTKDLFPENYQKVLDEHLRLERKATPLINESIEIEGRMEAAPFVTGSDKFTRLGIKSLLKEAVDEGQDYLSFSNGDVQMGRWNEEGLVDYYDKIIPKQAEKVAKSLDPDAFVGIKNIKDVEDLGGNRGKGRLVIEITPKMRDAIRGGQPLFTVPSLPLSGILSDDKKTQQQGLL